MRRLRGIGRVRRGGVPLMPMHPIRMAVAVGLVCLVTQVVGPAAVPAAENHAQGVSADEVRVGALVTKTSPTGRPYADAVVGARAYFDLVNKRGGVQGRKIRLTDVIDDQARASQNVAGARSLVEEKKVFAVLPVVTSIFASARYLAEQGIPTFGWNINAEWTKGPNLFGEKGSYYCFNCPQIAPAFIAQQVGAKRVAILSYNAPQSTECAQGQQAAYEKWGLEVVFVDRSLNFGFTDLSADVEQIRENKVDFVSTCMDINGEVNIARALRQGGLNDITFYAPEGYDPKVIEKFGDELDGVHFVVEFLPFELSSQSKGMTRFVKAMKKIGKTPNAQSIAGWINAALFVEGLRLAGPNPTWESVVDAINTRVTDFTAGGVMPAIDWRVAHDARPRTCSAYVLAQGGKFVPRFAEPGKPYVCFRQDPLPATLDAPERAAK